MSAEAGVPDEEVKPSRSGWAKASLAMGIAGFTVLPVVGAVFAIIFARIAKKQILTTDLEGMGIATAGQTLGIVGRSDSGPGTRSATS